MILQYMGFNNNWCYEEANTITWAMVYVGRETKDYRKDGVRWKIHQADSNSDAEKYAKEMHEAVDKLIKSETRCSDDIVYMIGSGNRFDEMENVCVVTLKDKGKHITYVFNSGVYMLNNSGGTVRKIA